MKVSEFSLFSVHSIGLLMRRVFMMRTFSMVFQSSLLVVLEPSPLMKGKTHTSTLMSNSETYLQVC